MPRVCSICRVKNDLTLFRVPINSVRAQKWQEVFGTQETLVPGKTVLCEKHFLSTDIVRQKEIKDPITNHVISTIALSKTILKPDAVPILGVKIPFKTYSRIPTSTTVKESSNVVKPIEIGPRTDELISQEFCEELNDLKENDASKFGPKKLVFSNNSEPYDNLLAYSLPSNLCLTLFENKTKICIPSSWNRILPQNSPNTTIFCEVLTNLKEPAVPVFGKTVAVNEKSFVSLSYLGKSISLEYFNQIKELKTISELENLIQQFDKQIMCNGVNIRENLIRHKPSNTFMDQIGNLRHLKCIMLSNNNKNVCENCASIKQSIRTNKYRQIKKRTSEYKRIHLNVTPSKSKKLQNLRQKAKKLQQNKKRGQIQLKNLQSKLDKAKITLRNINNNSLMNELRSSNKMEHNQLLLVEEILSASKRKSERGRRYNEEWVMLCMLFHIRSPSGYAYLRNNNILPLPCTRTIRKYLSIINTSCGFDPKFFEIFKMNLSTKPEMQKHGLLLLDEMSVRESISVNSKTLTYSGLIDFGPEDEDLTSLPKPTSLNDKATHALVFMFQPLADNYTQPIAMFASSGPVKGVTLAQLIIKATILLEKSGAYVHGFIADGAQTNRKVWNEYGLGGKLNNCRNYVEHFVDPERKFFAFSDTPHLLKNIRNRFYNKKELETPLGIIKWKFFEKLYEEDCHVTSSYLKVCPKITKNHVHLVNSSLKMRVRYAAQIFSNSVVVGLEFYKKRNINGFENCDPTIKFCKLINDMFDSLNRKHTFDGINLESSDYKILKESLQFLNDWEDMFHNRKITENQFLTANTAEGLRVTLQSTLDIIEYLITRYNFTYVLTGKINQDALERFFGTIRQAAGANDHPGTPTFIQLYKLLSVYSILRPPKYGNCSIDTDTSNQSSNLIKISDLKSIYDNKSESALGTLKTKLDDILLEDLWEFTDISEHDYSYAPVIDCLIYYVTGYLCKQILKHSQCSVCKEAIIWNGKLQGPESELTELKSRGKLIHPNKKFFHFIFKIEEYFILHIDSPYVFEEVVEDILTNECLGFPCPQHKDEIITYSIRYYINMRMRQFTRQLNQNNQKENQKRKKLSKFCTT